MNRSNCRHDGANLYVTPATARDVMNASGRKGMCITVIHPVERRGFHLDVGEAHLQHVDGSVIFQAEADRGDGVMLVFDGRLCSHPGDRQTNFVTLKLRGQRTEAGGLRLVG